MKYQHVSTNNNFLTDILDAMYIPDVWKNYEIRESEPEQIYVQKVIVVYVNIDPAANVDPINITTV